MLRYDLVIIGGGAAGLMAAISAKEEAVESILIIEREEQLGGILNQYIHAGFTYKDEVNLTGPEYIEKLINEIGKFNINYMVNSLAMDLTKEKVVTLVCQTGIVEVEAKAIILATGCRERPKGTTNILGSKAAGIFTAGTVQKIVNIEGYMPGKQVVILGTGDLGIIMARRMSIEGANVKAVVETAAFPMSSRKNIKDCLLDFNIPLMLCYAVIDISGKERVQGVTIAKVDENKVAISGSEEYIACDTLILSVGMLPECELLKKAGGNISTATGGPEVDENMKTSVEGIFACGNVLYFHELTDNVIHESYTAGKNAAEQVYKALNTLK